MKEVPNMTMDFVDVRDVAMAHLQAVKAEAALNRRFIISADEVWFRQVAEWLAAEFNPQGFTVTATQAEQDQRENCLMDSTASRDVLKVTYRPVKESAIDTINALI